nr:RNA-dependent RNA polymerase [Blackcurrant reversion virus]
IGNIENIGARPYTSGKTAFVAVPQHLLYSPPVLQEKLPGSAQPVTIQVEVKQPAILSKDDPRIPEGTSYDPLIDGMAKFSHPMAVLDENVCNEVAQDIVESWHDCFQDLQDVSDEIAINGSTEMDYEPFNLQSSEGYPYVTQRKPGESGKIRFFEMDPYTGLKSLIPNTLPAMRYEALQRDCFTSVPEMVCIETPKDECLPLRKICIKPKTRLFSILPLEFNLLLRKKFLHFSSSLQMHRDTLPTQVGVNPYSREWGELLQRLRAQSSVAINCDYASFDGLLTGQILEKIGTMINKMYIGSEASKIQRLNLLMSIVNRKSICGARVYEVRAGIPSGCALTVLLNSIFNEFLIRFVWRTTIIGVPRERFSQYVTLLIYGDDNLIAVHPDYLPHFNGEIIRTRLADVNVIITDGSDKTAEKIEEKPLVQLDFLKRRFRKLNDGTVYAPLDLASVYTSLQNVTMGAGSIHIALQNNVHNALLELYLHGNETWFNHLRDFYRKSHAWVNLPSWREAFAFHQGQISGVTPWTPYQMFDVPVDGGRLRAMMANQGEAAFSTHLGREIYICGPKWCVSDPEHQFVVSTTPLRSADRGSGIHRAIEYPCNGVGRLPSQDWVTKFKSSAHRVTAEIRKAHASGKAIYFRDDPPYVANWCAAIGFAQGLGYDYKSMINLYHDVSVPGSDALYFYFEQRARRALPEPYIPPHLRTRVR